MMNVPTFSFLLLRVILYKTLNTLKIMFSKEISVLSFIIRYQILQLN